VQGADRLRDDVLDRSGAGKRGGEPTGDQQATALGALPVSDPATGKSLVFGSISPELPARDGKP
jgi:hypothetical protein